MSGQLLVPVHCALSLVLLFGPVAPGIIEADEEEALAVIKSSGATVLRRQQELEIDFHLKGRMTAGRALQHVGQLENVVWLNLGNTNVSDHDLVHLKKLNKLRSLHLEKTTIGDEGIKHLMDLKQLEYLNLYSTNITDVSLERLARLPRLKKLYIWQTKTTVAGVKRIADSHPQLKIVRGINLTQLPSEFPPTEQEAKPKVALKWYPVERRDQAPVRSDNGVNCQVWFENKSGSAIKLYWISYGAGELKLYGTLKPGELRKQNSYARNAWLVTDLADKALGYFVIKDDDARAIIP